MAFNYATGSIMGRKPKVGSAIQSGNAGNALVKSIRGGKKK